MQVTKIKDKFYVKGSQGDIYTINKHLQCDCPGYFVYHKCKHQKAVIKAIESGEYEEVSSNHSIISQQEIRRQDYINQMLDKSWVCMPYGYVKESNWIRQFKIESFI